MYGSSQRMLFMVLVLLGQMVNSYRGGRFPVAFRHYYRSTVDYHELYPSYTSTMLSASSSVGGNPMSQPKTQAGIPSSTIYLLYQCHSFLPTYKNQPQCRFIVGALIVPSTQGGESQLLILENFNQIQSGEKKKFGVIGTSDLTNNHRQMVELLAYALVLSGNHVFTSAGGNNGTNVAVIKGALRACNPDLLTVILPQSLYQQPPEIHPLLLSVANLVQQPEYDDVDIKQAAYICNEVLISNVDKMLVFVYHDSTTILDAVDNATGDVETVHFYLD